MKIVAVVQTRMSSRRLPNKVMKKILGRSLLWHIKNRLENCKLIDEITIAATNDPKDAMIERFARRNKLKIYRGSENDIVDRLYKAATTFNADVIIRLWGDSPLIDPVIVDELIAKFLDQKADYANNFSPRTFPLGMNFEIYSFKALEKIWKEANSSFFFRKYPLDYICKYPNLFRRVHLKFETDFSSLHLTVDWPQDLIFIRKIFEKLYQRESVFGLSDILALIKQNPELKKINLGLKRDEEYLLDKQKWIEKIKKT